MKIRRIISTTLTLTLLIVGSSFAQHKYSCQVGEVAFGGYDLVSYFQDGPLLGKKELALDYDGVVLQFSTKANQQTFLKNPEKYIPAYGGWCATAAAQNTYVVPNFTMYKIQDGKLLLFEVRGFFNGKSHWDKDPLKHEFLADRSYRNKFGDSKKTIAD